VGKKARSPSISRRRLLQGAAVLLVNSAFASSPDVRQPRETARNDDVEYGQLLPLARAGFHVIAPDLRTRLTGCSSSSCSKFK
jgi:hypothetical protein